MKLTLVLAVLIGTFALACSIVTPVPVEPTPNAWMLEIRAEANLREEATDWFEKGVLLSRRGQYQDVIEAFDKTLEINPRKYFYHERAVSYQALRQHRHAVQDLTPVMNG
jgi:tetratricopeptide (TPR) repeat protein